MRLQHGLLVVCAALAAATAEAKDSPQSVLDDAKVLGRKGEHAKAAERYGDAIALAQAAGDLELEGMVADAFEEWFEALPADPVAEKSDKPGKQTSDAPTRPALLAAVMRKLEPNRCGAFVSAPVLARNVLLLGTQCGDLASAADAAKVLAAQTTKKMGGRATGVLSHYAAGMKTESEGRFTDAGTALDGATGEAVNAHWVSLATHIATEASASWVKAGDPAKAAASLTAAAAAFGETPDTWLFQDWDRMARARLAGADASVFKPLDDLKARLPKGSSSNSAGGQGGKGGSGGLSDVGKLFSKLANGKPFVSGKRTPRGFELRFATKPDDKQSVEAGNGISYEEEGGVTVGLSGPSLALAMLDLKGGRGGLGGRTSPSYVRAFYLLAEGETWSVSKDGIVTIAR